MKSSKLGDQSLEIRGADEQVIVIREQAPRTGWLGEQVEQGFRELAHPLRGVTNDRLVLVASCGEMKEPDAFVKVRGAMPRSTKELAVFEELGALRAG